MKYLITTKLAVCTYAAIWMPFYLTASLFGVERISESLNHLMGVPEFFGFVGLLWIGIDLWRSKRTNDEKIWWTIVGFIFLPVAVPAYWFMFGWKETVYRYNDLKDPDPKAEQIMRGNE